MDDLGSERESDWALEKLLIIVDGRLNAYKPTVFTTNFNLEELEVQVGIRLASRILYNSLDLVVQEFGLAEKLSLKKKLCRNKSA